MITSRRSEGSDVRQVVDGAEQIPAASQRIRREDDRKLPLDEEEREVVGDGVRRRDRDQAAQVEICVVADRA